MQSAVTMYVTLTVLAAATAAVVAGPNKNILFIAVDDMRPSIGAFNFSLAHTPNLDKLASEGLVFKRAYVQYAFCAPSRNSFMSGRRPDTTRVWNFQDHFRQPVSAPGGGAGGENWLSLPEYFKKAGYLTVGSGKLFHPGVPPDNDAPLSWSPGYDYYCPECTPPKCPSSSASGPANGAFRCVTEDPPNDFTLCATNTSADESRFELQLEDQRIRDNCIKHLEVANTTIASGKFDNFFVGCGFHKPHVPWVFPAEFLDYYPTSLDDIPLASDPYAPEGMPPAAWHFPADVHGMDLSQPNGTANFTRSRVFRRGYYAAISYTDYNIGMLLGRLADLGFEDNTVVVVFGDHGWQLGEHDTWAKMTNFEVALRTPLIIRAPWMPASIGRVTSVLAEAVDFYPTLAALVGLPDPITKGQELNGTSLLPVFENPDDISCKDAAYSQFAKPSKKNPYAFWPTPARNETEIMGYSVRVPDWRCTVWFGFDGTTVTVDTNDVLGVELYDHRGDPGELDWAGEHRNAASDVENAQVLSQLKQMIMDYIRLR
eukprot:m.181696 g.181696  ORF g.181696 m.181696 type:complete len:542 (-) comp15341_c0_seq1:76-1701(-)